MKRPRKRARPKAKKAVKATAKVPKPITARSDDDDYDDEEELAERYSVGWLGPYPIRIYRRGNKYFFCGQEFSEEGPYGSLKEALEEAESFWLGDDGGFWKTREEAEKHADWMREKGYDVRGKYLG